MRHYPPTLREEDPEEPGQPGTEERKRAEPPVAELESRLGKSARRAFSPALFRPLLQSGSAF